MNPHLLRWYHRLPSPARTAIASARGLHLRQWRYGPETDRLVDEALAREQWSDARWHAWRDERLAFVLHRARHQVPYYRDQWDHGSAPNDGRAFQPLHQWPVLEKSQIRADPGRFLADDCSPRRMFHEHTSGTSGTPLELWWSRETVRQWYALFEARWRLWYGVSRNDRWGVLGGQLIVPFSRRRPPFWVWNSPMRQLYLSSYHLALDLVPAYLSAISHYRIEYLYGYPSALYALAQEAVRLNRRVALRVVVTNAEPLYGYQREVIADAFICPVRETYGMSEIVTAASECAEGRLHLWPEVGVAEIVPDGEDDAKAGTGRLVCTGLLNADMPLVRYAVGDRAALPHVRTPCACGRTLPTLGRIEGRDDDVLYSADGRRIGRLDSVFKLSLPIREAQIVQESLRRIRVRYVPAPGFGVRTERELVRALQEHLGAMQVVLEQLDEIPRTAAGKFRAVICAIPRDQRTTVGVQCGSES